MFIKESIGKEIYSPTYAKYGDSKGKRLKALLEIEAPSTVGKVLSDLIDLWEYQTKIPTKDQADKLLLCRKTIMRLTGKQVEPEPVQSDEEFLRVDFSQISLSKLPIEPGLIPIVEARLVEAAKLAEV